MYESFLALLFRKRTLSCRHSRRGTGREQSAGETKNQPSVWGGGQSRSPLGHEEATSTPIALVSLDVDVATAAEHGEGIVRCSLRAVEVMREGGDELARPHV